MATLSSTNYPTLMDLAKITDSNGNIATVVEILAEKNEFLNRMSWMEGNEKTGHQVTIRTGLPVPSKRQFNTFTKPTKGNTAQVTFNTMMVDAWSEVDCALADLGGNAAAWRHAEDRAHVEAMGQTMANTFFYGNEDEDPAEFNGLSRYYKALTGEVTSNNVIDGKSALGGTDASASDTLNSIWLVGSGPNTITGITPKGTRSGIQMNDLGKVSKEGSSDGTTFDGLMMVYRSYYYWYAGLAIENWQYGVRIANIGVNKVATGITSPAPTFQTLPELMHQAMSRLPDMSKGMPAWYMSRRAKMVFEQSVSRIQAEAGLSTDMVGGMMMPTWHGIPILVCDALSVDEPLVS